MQIQAHNGQLLNIQILNSIDSPERFRKLLDSLEVNVRGLQSLGITGSAYCFTLVSLLTSRLPKDLRIEWAKRERSEDSDVHVFLKFYKCFHNTMAAAVPEMIQPSTLANGVSHLMDEMERCLRTLEIGASLTKFFPKRRMERKKFIVRLETRQILWQRPMAAKDTHEGSVDLREVKEVRRGKLSKDFERWPEDSRKYESCQCLVVIYGNEFRLSTLSLVASTSEECDTWVKGLTYLVKNTIESQYPLQVERWLRKEFYAMQNQKDLVSLKDVKAFLPRVNYKVSSSRLKELFQEVDSRNKGEIGFEAFAMLYHKLVNDSSLFQELFHSYSSDQKIVSASEFYSFVTEEQQEKFTNVNVVNDILRNYLQNPLRDTQESYLTIAEFMEFLFSKENDIWDKKNDSITDDMTQPLSSYWIASSHNTFHVNERGQSQCSIGAQSKVCFLLNLTGHNINNLRFADDTALISTTEEKLQVLLDKVVENSEGMGLSINVKKTKSITISKQTTAPVCKLTVGKKQIEHKTQFNYLGSYITSDGKSRMAEKNVQANSESLPPPPSEDIIQVAKLDYENFCFQHPTISAEDALPFLIKAANRTSVGADNIPHSTFKKYLTGDQFQSESSVEAYARCLRLGCRCIELDCWDGPDGMPYIYHGHTLTSKIKFIDVIKVIKEHAFVTSEYPVILSIEDHCTLPQQRNMSAAFIDYFGDMLLIQPFNKDETKLPSPWQLRRKIIIKHKKLPEGSDEGFVITCSEEGNDVDLSNSMKNGILYLEDPIDRRWNPHFFVLNANKLHYSEDQSERIHNREETEDESNSSGPPEGTPIEELHLEERWFHGKLAGGRAKAEALLNEYSNLGDGTFLVRESETFVGDYTLSFWRQGRVNHCRIKSRLDHGQNKFYLIDTVMFDSLYSLIVHYQSHPLRSQEFYMNLNEPVPQPNRHENKDWFHCNLERAEAEEMLKRVPYDGAFLIRRTWNDDSNFAISFRAEKKIKHCRIKHENRWYSIGTAQFGTLVELVNYYETHPLYRRMKLKYAVNKLLVNRIGADPEENATYGVPGQYMDPNTFTSKITVKALYDYRAQRQDELSFCKHAIITNVNKQDGGWWRGDYGGKKQHYFPSNYVEEVEDHDSLDNSGEAAPLGSLQKGSVDIAGCSVEILPHGRADAGQDFVFRLGQQHQMTSMEIAADSIEALIDWVSKIRETSQAANDKLSRVYPKGQRIDSSNYDPVPMWNCGCQMAALNYQTADKPMQLDYSKFLKNGRCGYVLRPKYMFDESFNPYDYQTLKEVQPLTISLRVIAARHLTKTNKGIISPFVEVEIIGAEYDNNNKYRTKTIGDNGLCPIWNEEPVIFDILNPDCCMIRFCVSEEDMFSEPNFLGQATYPICCIRSGYRSVLLKNGFSENLELSALLVHISIQSSENDTHSSIQARTQCNSLTQQMNEFELIDDVPNAERCNVEHMHESNLTFISLVLLPLRVNMYVSCLSVGHISKVGISVRMMIGVDILRYAFAQQWRVSVEGWKLMDFKLKSIHPEYFDVDLSKIQSTPVTIGRGPLTGIKESRCSRNQIRLSTNTSGESIFVCRLGPNTSKINGKILEKGINTVITDGDMLSILDDQFSFKLIKDNQSKATTLKANKSPEKQTSVTDFFKGSEKKKRKHVEISQCIENDTGKSKEVDAGNESDDESRLENIKAKLKRLRENEVDSGILNSKDFKPPDNDQIIAEQSVWEKHNEFLIYTSKGVKSSSKIAAFDIDGTIITTKSGKVFAVDFDDWKIYISDIPQKLKELYRNDYKIVFISNQMSIGKGHKCPEKFKSKVEAIVKKCNVPVQALIGTHGGFYRKPAPGLWRHLEEKANHDISVDYNSSFYVGDAAGRPVKFLPGRKKDFACSDRLFALNLGLKFHTPEEYFLKHRPASFNLPEFDPRNISGCDLFDPPSAKLTSESPEVIVLVGMPAAGKSHFAETHLTPKGYSCVNRDTLGTWQKCVSKCDSYLSKGKSVVIDNTNLDVKSRKRFIDCAKKANVGCRCFVFDISIECAKHNNKFRIITDVDKTHAPISNIILYSFRKNFEPPETKEGFSEIIKINFIPKFKSDDDEKLYHMFLMEK
ncbi:1-phosphatidylinositol 4,5-bisphosphate phosphodiesterase gamma-1 [Nymphon striatum]|nr:1-phosphatidylinositol 4,5-bisphosphate phosphodiesterase gamma-1 [Nymphon striatum]